MAWKGLSLVVWRLMTSVWSPIHCIYDSRYLCLAGGRKKISFIGMEVLRSAYFKNGIVLSCIFGIIAFQ